uniref:Uncharacterized protein n=1 Tax=Oryza sativa subsp. japonica TaxID=39947 RepID=Q6Z2I4_ORYSJ|nr:hypothetical protein [Oryza sativa Japonica Group]
MAGRAATWGRGVGARRGAEKAAARTVSATVAVVGLLVEVPIRLSDSDAIPWAWGSDNKTPNPLASA